MPIDRIGKGGGIPPQTPGATGPDAAAPTAASKAFEVSPTEGAKKAGAADAVTGSSALDELRAGKIDVNTYVDRKLDEATEHLKGLRTSELDHIRGVLRDKIVHDPQIADLVRQAAGSVPAPSDE